MKEIIFKNLITRTLFICTCLLFFVFSGKTMAADTYSCKSIEVKQGNGTSEIDSGFWRKGGSIKVKFLLKLTESKTDLQIEQDLQFAYDKGWVFLVDPWINDVVDDLGEIQDVSSGGEILKEVILTIPQSYLTMYQNETDFKAGIFSGQCNKGGNNSSHCTTPIPIVGGKNYNGENKCEIKIFIFEKAPNDSAPEPDKCADDVTGRFTCYRQEDNTWAANLGASLDYDTKCTQPVDIAKLMLTCNESLSREVPKSSWCVPCPENQSITLPSDSILVNNAGEVCNDNKICNSAVFECKVVSSTIVRDGDSQTDIKKCVYQSGLASIDDYCIVGSDQCSKEYECHGSTTYGVNENNLNNYLLGSEGKCKLNNSELYDKMVRCDGNISSDCDKYLANPLLRGYKVARCQNTASGIGVCYFDTEEDGDIAKLNAGIEITPAISPVIPAPPSRFIERCKGDLSCANCVARKVVTTAKPDASPPEKATYQPFLTYADAAATEYTYNQEVDKWKQGQLDDGDYTQAPTPTEFAYTGYIYTSLGCLDTTDNGLITRVVQIALGIIGSVILVRFAQAALKLQGGSSPEDKAEGIEIVTSAVVALLLFVMSMIVLRFIGVDVFQIFSPGSFEIG